MQFISSFKIILYILISLFFFILIYLQFLNKQIKVNLSDKIIFVGHAYGKHGDLVIPEISLKEFLIKNKPNLIFFGGDMTEKHEDYKIFKSYFSKNYNYYTIKGNHDLDLWKFEDYWSEKSIKNFKFYNMEMDENYFFDYDLLKNYNNTYFLSHFVWFNQLFENIGVNVANQIIRENFENMKLSKIEHLDFGNNNVYLAGDCGAFAQNIPYIKTWYKNSIFVCSGIGNKIGHNIVIIDENLSPVFFDNNGKTVKHSCKSYKGFYSNKIEVCLPQIKEYENMWKNLNNNLG